MREYWKDQLGLNTGAPAVLYDLIARHPEKEPIKHEKIFRQAQNHLKNEPSEMQNIQRVIEIEPFLSNTEFLFRYLAQPDIKHITDSKNELNKFREIIKRSAAINTDPSLPRLSELIQIMTAEGDLLNWLMGILSYHQKISKDRGGNAWFEIDEKGHIKHWFSPRISSDLNTIPKFLANPIWWHTYYLETLRSIQAGLQ